MKDTTLQLNEAIEGFLNSGIQSVKWAYKPVPEKWSKKELSAI